MAASSPISAGVNSPQKPIARSAASSGSSTGMAPGAILNPSAIKLPLRFMFAGMLALVIGVAWILVRPEILSDYHYNPHILALTHLFTLGWVTTIIMGALYQLAPVALETRLYSERLASWQFYLHLAGVIGMVAMFWMGNMQQVGHFGSLVGTGMALFAFNIGKTLARVPRWNLVATSIAAALGWMLLTMLAGLYLAASKCWNFSPFSPLAQMHTHAHLGALGFFAMLIVGVSYKLVPMFLLSEVQNPRRAAWSIGLLNCGLAGLLITLPLQSKWKLAFAYVIVAGLAQYGAEMLAIWRARKRRTYDWGLRYFFTGLWLLIPLCIAAVVLSQPSLPSTHFIGQTENAYGFLALVGLVTLCIIGMLYKILPFLVWYASYSTKVGRYKVPAMHELYSSRLQVAGYFLFLGGLAGTAITVIAGKPETVRCAWLAICASLLVTALNFRKILLHLLHPKYEALNFGQAGLPKRAAPDAKIPAHGQNPSLLLRPAMKPGTNL